MKPRVVDADIASGPTVDLFNSASLSRLRGSSIINAVAPLSGLAAHADLASMIADDRLHDRPVPSPVPWALLV